MRQGADLWQQLLNRQLRRRSSRPMASLASSLSWMPPKAPLDMRPRVARRRDGRCAVDDGCRVGRRLGGGRVARIAAAMRPRRGARFRDVGAAERREQRHVGGGEGARRRRAGAACARRWRCAARTRRTGVPLGWRPAQRAQRLGDRGRVVREVVVDAHAVATPSRSCRRRTPPKRGSARVRSRDGDAGALGGQRDRRERVADVVARPASGDTTRPQLLPPTKRSNGCAPRLGGAGAASQCGVTSPVSSPSSA